MHSAHGNIIFDIHEQSLVFKKYTTCWVFLHTVEISGDVIDARLTDGTNERTREEDNNATQPLDAGRQSFATNVKNATSHYLNHVI